MEEDIIEDEDVEEEVKLSTELRWNVTSVIILDISNMNVQDGIKKQIIWREVQSLTCY